MIANSKRLNFFPWGFLVILLLAPILADAGVLTGSFTSIPQGTDIDLTVLGPLDWVHWGFTPRPASIGRLA
jgi:hypothetical protein